MRVRRIVAPSFALALTAGIAVSGCGQDAPADGPIPIGGIFTLTEPARDVSTLNGLHLAVSEINARGGVDVGGTRRELALQVLNDDALPPKAVANANKLVNQRNVVALLGPVKSTLAIPVGAVAERGGVPMITPGSTNPETTRGRRYVFRTIMTDDFQGAVAASFVRNAIGLRRAALYYDASSQYSTGIASSFRAGFVRHRGTVVATRTYTADQPSHVGGMRGLARSRPDVLYLPNTAEDVAVQGRRARTLGMRTILLGGDTWAGQSFLRSPAFDGSYHTAQWSPDLDDPRSQRFVAAYRKRYGEDPTQYSATAYDAVGLLAEAVSRARTIAPRAIRDELDRIDTYDGVSARLRYHDGGDPLATAVVVHSTRRGTRVVARITPESISPEPIGSP